MKKRLLTLGFISLLAALLAPIFRTFVREVIVIPLLYLFWLGRFFIEAIPQSGLWAGFFIICLLILAASLLEKKGHKPKAPQLAEADRGRIEDWVNLINRAAQDDYFKWRLAQHLQKLTLNAIAHHKGQSLRETRQQLRQGALEMPPELQAYFQASLKSLGHLPAPKRFFQVRPKASSPLDLDPLEVVRFLEHFQSSEFRVLVETLNPEP